MFKAAGTQTHGHVHCRTVFQCFSRAAACAHLNACSGVFSAPVPMVDVGCRVRGVFLLRVKLRCCRRLAGFVSSPKWSFLKRLLKIVIVYRAG